MARRLSAFSCSRRIRSNLKRLKSNVVSCLSLLSPNHQKSTGTWPMCPRLSLWFKTIEMHQCNIKTSNTHFDVFSGSFSSLSQNHKKQ